MVLAHRDKTGAILHVLPCITPAGGNVNLSQHTVFGGKSQPEDDGNDADI